MAKYFIHAGLQFETITVKRSVLVINPPPNQADLDVEAVTMESVVKALGDFVSGDTDQEKIDNLRGWWDQHDGLDILQRSARELLNRNAPLLDNPIRGDGESGTNYVHRLSHEYILPPHCAEGLHPAATSDDDDLRDREHFRIILNTLQFKHDNVHKYDTPAAAWLAWVAYLTVQRADIDRIEGTRAYLDIRGLNVNSDPS